MSGVEVRELRGSDREQLAELVNAHIEAVLPGRSVSVNAVLSQLEREPDEPIVDPWVVARKTMVAIERQAVVAAAHLLRYGAGTEVGETYRGAGEIRWLVCRPDRTSAGDALASACVAALQAWGVSRLNADGGLPSPGVYGVPDCWPHIREIYTRAGFRHDGPTEIIFIAQLCDLPAADAAAPAGVQISREVGTSGTRFRAEADGRTVGLIDVATDLTRGGTLSRFAGLGDVGNLYVAEELRRQGLATHLVAHAARWLRLGSVDQLLAYAWPEETAEIGFYQRLGFRELTRTARGWVHQQA